MPKHDHLRDPSKTPLDDSKIPEGISRQTVGPIPEGISSRFHSCLFMFRDEEREDPNPIIAVEPDGRCKIDLVGYAIIPSEVYNRYVDMAERLAELEAANLMKDILSKPREVKTENKIIELFRNIFKRNK